MDGEEQGAKVRRGFEFRGLEFHSSRMWCWASVERALRVMQRLRLNALIFHQNDILQQLVFPDDFYPPRSEWYSLRRHHIDNDKRYIQKVIREAGRAGVDFYFEIKEICYHDDLLEFYPELLKPDGSICATHPFWWEYLETKIRALLAEVPGFSGIIVSPGTNETKVSIAHNPRIGQVGEHDQWIEFDCWGQFYGLGFFPCSVIEDMKNRMEYCLARGATGIWLRTDWEMTTEGSAFNSFNLLNVFGGASLAQDLDTDFYDIYAAWLRHGVLSPLHSESEMIEPEVPSSPQALTSLRDFMKASWRVMEKTIYVRGATIDECGMFPLTVDEAFRQMERREEWDPEVAKLLEPTEENLKAIFKEKSSALDEAGRLTEILNPDGLGLSAEMTGEIKVLLKLYLLYVRAFQLCTQVVFQTRRALATEMAAEATTARQFIADLAEHAELLLSELSDSSYSHLTYWMLDPERLRILIKDACSCLKQMGLWSPLITAIGPETAAAFYAPARALRNETWK